MGKNWVSSLVLGAVSIVAILCLHSCLEAEQKNIHEYRLKILEDAKVVSCAATMPATPTTIPAVSNFSSGVIIPGHWSHDNE